MKRFDQDLLDYINNLKIIDSHEHLPGNEKNYLAEKRDVITEILSLYIQNDLISSGMKQKTETSLLDTSRLVRERYAELLPWWDRCKYTGYGRMLSISIRDVLGEELAQGSIGRINEKFESLYSEGVYKRILREVSKIEFAVLDKRYQDQKTLQWISGIDNEIGYDREYFECVYRLDRFVNPQFLSDMRLVEELNDIRITSLEDWKEACIQTIDRVSSQGIIGFKTALAYSRNLAFAKTDCSDAERVQ